MSGRPRGPAGHGKLRDLHKELDKGIVPKTSYVHYTVWQAAEDWLATGLDGRSAKRSGRTRTSISRS
jgi:hypothetical protein